MRIPKMLIPNRCWRAILFLALGHLMTVTHVQAQCNSTTKGFNAVYQSCTQNHTQGSFAVVDATQYLGTDICNAIEQAINATYNQGTVWNYGIVVDARGINPTQSCASNPFDPTLVPVIPPSTVVLLPSGTITITKPWTLPAFTRIIGEGPGTTILQANFTGCSQSTPCDMVDMGSINNYSAYNCSNPSMVVDCPGITIEHLGLNGNNQSNVNGIANTTAQELSYVDDVAFSNIPGTALSLLSIPGGSQNGGNSQNSGPYSNLTMSNVGTCVTINAAVGIPFGTRGIHGLTCSTSTSSGAAIYLYGPGNSLEDVSLTGSNTYGILIGTPNATNAAQNNVLFNIRGTGFTNLIYISNFSSTNSNQTNCPAKFNPAMGTPPVYNVCNITIMGVTNGTSGSTTINDLVSGATLTDSNLGMYILGEPVQSGSASNHTNDTFLGNSHFTTSLKFPTWLVGSTQASGLACPSAGSLYSVTSGAAPTLLECDSSGSLGWQPVK
jgi:hypothetical protein